MSYDLGSDWERIMEAVQRAPSIFNTRPWEFKFEPPDHPDRVELWLRADLGEYDGPPGKRVHDAAARARAREERAREAREREARAREARARAAARERGHDGMVRTRALTRTRENVVRARAREKVVRARARENVISCGAALFNLRLAIRVAGHELDVRLLPEWDSSDRIIAELRRPVLLAVIEVVTGRIMKPSRSEQELYEAIERRHTNRQPYAILPAPIPIITAMEEAAAREGAYLRLLTTSEARKWLRLTAKVDSGQFRAPFPRAGVSRKNYGPTPDKGYSPVRRDFEDVSKKVRRYERKPQLMALSTDDDEPLDWLRAGQALQRAILTGTRYSVSARYGMAARYHAPVEYGIPARRHFRKPDELARFGLSTSFLTELLEWEDVTGRDVTGVDVLGNARRWPWRWRYPELPQMVMRVGYAADQSEGELPPKIQLDAEETQPSQQPPTGASALSAD